MSIRVLDAERDAPAVADLFARSADYIWLERGEAPTPALVAEFFNGAPPGGDARDGVRLGLWRGDVLDGIAELAFDYPEPGDAFLGLLQLAEEARGQGQGAAFLRRIEDEARARGAPQLYIAVLDENLRGRAFWVREGFVVGLTNRVTTQGQKTHRATRMVKPL